MKLKILTRKVHYWASIIIALPLLVIITTGLLLQLKKEIGWVQPPEKRGGIPALTLPAILDMAKTVPEAGIADWSDVPRIEIRPARGLVKVVSANRTEIQLDAATGQILQVATRRSDLIESLHDGSWFHSKAKLLIFFPAGVASLGLLITGIYLFFLPIYAKRQGRLRRRASVNRNSGVESGEAKPRNATTP